LVRVAKYSVIKEFLLFLDHGTEHRTKHVHSEPKFSKPSFVKNDDIDVHQHNRHHQKTSFIQNDEIDAPKTDQHLLRTSFIQNEEISIPINDRHHHKTSSIQNDKIDAPQHHHKPPKVADIRTTKTEDRKLLSSAPNTAKARGNIIISRFTQNQVFLYVKLRFNFKFRP
jgi:hypothetical protein